MKFDVKRLGSACANAGKVFGAQFKKNTPTILTVFGLFEMGMCVYYTYEKAADIKELIVDYKMARDNGNPVPAKTVIKTAAPVVGPIAIHGLTAATAFIASNRISTKRLAAVTAAYSITATDLKELKNKVNEIVEPEKVEQIKKEVAQSSQSRSDASRNVNYIHETGDGDVLFYDKFSGRYFKSNPDHLRKTIVDLDYKLFSETYLTLNDFYDAIGLPHVDLGYDFGWDMSSGQRIDPDFVAVIGFGGQPCLQLDYECWPVWKSSIS